MKHIIAIIFSAIILVWGTLLSGYSFVFGDTSSSLENTQKDIKNTREAPRDISFVSDLRRNFYLDDEFLRSGIVVFQSNTDISDLTIHSSCDIDSDFLYYYKNFYFFLLEYRDAACNDSRISLKNDSIIYVNSQGILKLHTKANILQTYLDMSTPRLEGEYRDIVESYKKNALYRNYQASHGIENLKQYYKKYQANEDLYILENIDTILTGRKKAYISPVPGYFLQKQASKVPNAARPYRAAYTDGIHHGWDIDAPLGTPVVALDDGIIIRVRDGFTQSDFENIVYGTDLSEEQKLKNLDILRGNQVWLKTLKGEVIFYSHLEEVSAELQEGMYVEAGSYIGSVGITGVPGEGYEDFHLHFDIKIPPFTPGREGTYTYMEYMQWPWTGKGQTQAEVFDLIDILFTQDYEADHKK